MAYVKRGKNDAIDAAASCEAVRRPTVRTVPVKTVDQQAQLMQHRVRDLMIRQRTQSINALRSHMAELGIVAARSSLISVLPNTVIIPLGVDLSYACVEIHIAGDMAQWS